MNFAVAQVLGILTTAIGIAMVQLKDMRLILGAEILVNALAAITYLLLGGTSALWISLFAILHATINILCQRSGKQPPRPVFFIFSPLYILCCLVTWTGPIDLLPAIASVCFSLSVHQPSPTGYRLCVLGKCSSWIVYNLIIGAYTTIFSQLFTILSVFTAFWREKRSKPEHTP